MGHGVIACDFCGDMIMEGRSGVWECDCGYKVDCNKPLNKPTTKREKETRCDLNLYIQDEETKYSFSGRIEAANILEIKYTCISTETVFVLPIMSKEEWKAFKEAGDIIFSIMEGSL